MTLRKRSVTIAGHATSVSLEPEFWRALADLAARGRVSINRLVEAIDAERDPRVNLSSAIRVHLLQELRQGIE